MASVKRKHNEPADSDSDAGYSEVALEFEDEIDISSALTGKRPKTLSTAKLSDGEDDEDLQEFIRDSIARRDVKEGTELLKKTKGKKTKIAKGETGGGSFQSMGLHPWLLRSLTLQGFRIPTPIQRLSIPALLANPPRDLVGMARTGSGKSLAYLVPLVQRLGGRHSATFGARALILLPARELALQILKVGKELARGWHAGEGDHAGDTQDVDEGKKGQSLRWGLVVGGESLDEQFEMISNNPDVIIATPGRLLHLIVEMNLDLKSVQYVVFDEADRLFEMGFQTALTEILHRLPATRQSLLFSATLPKSLVEFAKAGLQNPKLVRLDAETKISADLKMAFFSVKQAEKDACLLVLLREVIGVPFGNPATESEEANDKKGKGRAKAKHSEHAAAPHQTLIFAATKHHVEYLTNLLAAAGYASSHIYGSLDQVARTQQMDAFRRGRTNILVVTDVAARGIDIPVLENVVNYDFPQGARVFVHRVGRTARAGRQGWAWSFVTASELPYLLDLQLFLSRPIRNEVSGAGDQAYTESLVLGPFERDKLDEEVAYIQKLDQENHNLSTLRDVMRKGQGMYERSKGKASPASYHNTKEMLKDGRWGYIGTESGIHPVLLRRSPDTAAKLAEEAKRRALLKLVDSFRPAETILEIGARGNAETAALMKQRRKALSKAAQRASLASTSAAVIVADDGGRDAVHERDDSDGEELEMADEADIAAVFDVSNKKARAGKGSFRDEEFYMSHYQKDADTEKGYSLRDGASFAEQARNVAFDLTGDETSAQERQRRENKWDKKKKRFVRGTGEGADNVKLVKTESGVKLPVTYRSGRFDEWKAKTHMSLPKVGEAEPENARGGGGHGPGGRKYRHKQVVAAKPLDKLRGDYERKARQLKDGQQHNGGDQNPARGSSSRPSLEKGKGQPKKGSRFGGKPVGKVKNELKTVDQIRKARKTAEQRKLKNARAPRKKGKR
ncbi:ATP-dependent RNA helicase DBP10 [Dichomitus squalens]|uniref:RNA helicase n=1 Tax=Dichomitus squalens TaxID=114155 RepID=A0A4Q9NZX9_9APHY|nr:ATP-dependent RNA helicase DBP10 [Dichomitus squalens]TBU45892.1 ATP-dependent RNA helicase DBP10 [Dichomitus squalens]TBU56844.1 ATP-dependent RNA helicase DBP10 [Dichomitus squalens]